VNIQNRNGGDYADCRRTERAGKNCRAGNFLAHHSSKQNKVDATFDTFGFPTYISGTIELEIAASLNRHRELP